MGSTTEQDTRIDYVFGYGSLVEFKQPFVTAGRVFPAVPGRLRGFWRFWGAAMNNWEATDAEKHFVDPQSGLKPRIKVAYLDIAEREDSTVNGLAIPVDATRLAELDLREVNYSTHRRVASAFAPAIAASRSSLTVGTEAARDAQPCRRGRPMPLIHRQPPVRRPHNGSPSTALGPGRSSPSTSARPEPLRLRPARPRAAIPAPARRRRRLREGLERARRSTARSCRASASSNRRVGRSRGCRQRRTPRPRATRVQRVLHRRRRGAARIQGRRHAGS